MKTFLEMTFGPAELGILDEALNQWLLEHGHPIDSAERELAAAIFVNLFREGNDTMPALRDAARRHKALNDLARNVA